MAAASPTAKIPSATRSLPSANPVPAAHVFPPLIEGPIAIWRCTYQILVRNRRSGCATEIKRATAVKQWRGWADGGRKTLGSAASPPYVARMVHFIHTQRIALLAIALASAVLASACGGDDEAGDTTTTSPPSSTLATTTTTESATTTTAAITTTTSATTTTQATTTTVDTNALASGSGCTPGAGDLPDGEWFGLVDASPTDIDFDLACWFTGDAAVLASAEDGEESPPPNDYYVRNVNPRHTHDSLAAAAQAAWLPNVGDPGSEVTVPYADWLTWGEPIVVSICSPACGSPSQAARWSASRSSTFLRRVGRAAAPRLSLAAGPLAPRA